MRKAVKSLVRAPSRLDQSTSSLIRSAPKVTQAKSGLITSFNKEAFRLQSSLPHVAENLVFASNMNKEDLNEATNWYVHRPRIETIRLKSDANFLDFYSIDGSIAEPLGFGTFGSVYVCNAVTPNSPKVAVKVMNKAQQPFYQREIEMLKRVNHTTNCVKLLRILESPHKIYLVTDLLEGGDLFDYIVDRNVGLGTLTVRQALQITRHMLASLESCHEQNLAHLDVKPENYVFRTEFEQEGDELPKSELVLVDFGAAQPFVRKPFARNKDSYEKGMDELWLGTQQTKITGTASYISPEIFLYNRFSSRSDMWSLGVSLYMILTGKRPFDSNCEKTIQKMVVQEAHAKREESIFSNSRSLKKKQITPSVREFLKHLTEPKPEDRISSSEAISEVEALLRGSEI